MDLLKMGQELLGDKLGENAGGLMEALGSLTGGEGGSLDLASLAAKFQENGLAEQVQSWLGDGENAEVSADQMKSALGEDQIAAVASKMGVSTDDAANSLKDMLPGLLDKVSSGGAIKEEFGSAEGLMGLAKGLLNR